MHPQRGTKSHECSSATTAPKAFLRYRGTDTDLGYRYRPTNQHLYGLLYSFIVPEVQHLSLNVSTPCFRVHLSIAERCSGRLDHPMRMMRCKSKPLARLQPSMAAMQGQLQTHYVVLWCGVKLHLKRDRCPSACAFGNEAASCTERLLVDCIVLAVGATGRPWGKCSGRGPQACGGPWQEAECAGGASPGGHPGCAAGLRADPVQAAPPLPRPAHGPQC